MLAVLAHTQLLNGPCVPNENGDNTKLVGSLSYMKAISHDVL